MTTHTPNQFPSTGWTACHAVTADMPTKLLWQDPRWIYRILADDGTVCAPSHPTMRHNGVLYRRSATVIHSRDRNVGVAKLSQGPL